MKNSQQFKNSKKVTYIFTDIEADGPVPALHSMISLASVAKSDDGLTISEFEANLIPLEGATQHPETMKWWATEPKAWQLSTLNPQEPEEVMLKYVNWIDSLGGAPVFVAHPIGFDYMWVCWYLNKFTGRNPFEKNNGIDLLTYAMLKLDIDILSAHRRNWPNEWFGGHEHTHKAIDDARGYAEAFFKMRDFGSQASVPA